MSDWKEYIYQNTPHKPWFNTHFCLPYGHGHEESLHNLTKHNYFGNVKVIVWHQKLKFCKLSKQDSLIFI